jgi:predicted 3-demethylubiquinone-9 3-methyltransferase (glyoxalase superfamily)
METAMADGKILPFLMFQGEAEAAIDAYAALFAGSEIRDVIRNGPGGRRRRAPSSAPPSAWPVKPC